MTLNPFVRQLLSLCQNTPKKIILAEGDDDRVIAATDLLLGWNAVGQVTLVGNSTKISKTLPTSLKSHLSQLSIVDSSDAELQELSASVILNALKRKGKTPDRTAVSGIASNPLYQAGALLASGQADCVVAGAVATTGEVIRAALATVGLEPGIRTVSGSFFMSRDDTTYYYADAGVVIDPTAEQLIDIAASSCATWRHIMGTPPVVAFLSFSTKGSASHQAAEKMALACAGFHARFPEIEADGEFQFDAAIDFHVGSRKAPGSKVPGRANVFIFPDLNASNISYKITQRLGGFNAYGPILQGLARPYSDLSRGATAMDIAVSVLINSLRST